MKQTVDKILCPYDGTRNSERVFKKILNLAKKYKAKILILTCIKDISTFGFFKLKSDKEIEEFKKQNAINKIKELEKVAKKNQVPTKSKIVKCDIVSKKIVDYAKKEDVDIIAMSKSNPNTVTEKMYYEDTVERVFKEAPCTFIHVK